MEGSLLARDLGANGFQQGGGAMAAGNDTTPSSSPTTMSPGAITEPPIDTGTLISPGPLL